GCGQEVRHRSLAPVRGPLPRAHVMLELPRLLRSPPRHPVPRGVGYAAGAHPERHRLCHLAHAHLPLRALPGARWRLLRARCAPAVHRIRPSRAAPVSDGASWTDPTKVSEYLGRMRKGHPREAGDAMVVDLLPTAPRRLLDLGCGDGRMSAIAL